MTSEDDLPDAVQRLIHEGEENSALLVQHNSETALQPGGRGALRARASSLRTCTRRSWSTRISSRRSFRARA